MKTKRVALIGCGRLGSTLAISLWGKKYTISAIIDKNLANVRSIAQRVNCPILSVHVNDLPDNLPILLIATPDNSIHDVVSDLLKLDNGKLKHCLVAHASGAIACDILNPLIKKGARVASIHPIQTFQPSDSGPTNLKQVYFGIEADVNAIDDAEILVKDLGGIAVRIPSEAKPYYHLACSIASNFLVSLLYMVFEILSSLELNVSSINQMIKPLLMTTLKNVENSSPQKALTGPISRGDIETIKSHLHVLKQHFPDFLKSYRELATLATKISLEEKRITSDQSEKLIELLHSN